MAIDEALCAGLAAPIVEMSAIFGLQLRDTGAHLAAMPGRQSSS